jgi:hypothetical protein
VANAHGDVVPPGDNWTYPPYGGVVDDGYIYGRAAAVSKCDFATYIFATRALKRWACRSRAGWNCTSPTTRNSAACWGRAGCWSKS